MEDAWLTWAKRLQSIASTGLHFSRDRYDRERYEEIGRIANEMLGRFARDASDGLWALPGGFADVGMSAGENVVKEVQEEASLRVVAKRPYALRHKAKHGYPRDPRDFYKLLFLCEPIGDVSPQPGPDVMEVGFFRLEDLPPFSMSRTITEDITAAFASWRELTGLVRFD